MNGIVPGPTASDPSRGVTGTRWGAAHPSAAPGPRQATVEERKQQMAQLAELGVAIPEEYQKEMALAGEWQIVAEHDPPRHTKEEVNDDDDEEADQSDDDDPDAKKKKKTKKDDVRIRIDPKRKRPGDGSQSEGEAERVKKGPWGSRIKTYSNPQAGEDDELDRLLASTKPSPPVPTSSNARPTDPRQSDANPGQTHDPGHVHEEAHGTALVKEESSEHQDVDLRAAALESGSVTGTNPATGADSMPEGIFFKKRKAKDTRQHARPVG